jgi:hypothetical protein
MGIGGPFLKIVKNMYDKSSIRINVPDGLTDQFISDIGVKQGCVLSPTLFKLFINDINIIFNEECKPVKLYDEKISCLMFADDIVLLSENADGLQLAMNKLNAYTEKWRLKINIEKSKLMIFNKTGRLLKEKFTLNKKIIENVKQYTYLGLVFIPSGKFHTAIDTLYKKALKAMFKLRKAIRYLNISPKIALYIYDTLIRPIYTYASEIWGPFIKDQNKAFDLELDKYQFFDKQCFDKLDLKFCKAILGVNKKSNNTAVRGELGRYPAIIYIIKQTMKNWFRIAKYKENSVLYNTYLCNIEMMHSEKMCWGLNIKIFIELIGVPEFWDVPVGINKINSKLNNIILCMKQIYEFQWKRELNRTEGRNNKGGNKLRTYCTFKKEFNYEKYLDFQSNFDKRRSITKLRISAHRLEIEAGRYKNIDKRDRICTNCNLNEVEDEEHLLMTCPKYAEQRKLFLENVEMTYIYCETATVNEKFIFIMTCFDVEITHGLSKLLSKIIEDRGTF